LRLSSFHPTTRESLRDESGALEVRLAVLAAVMAVTSKSITSRRWGEEGKIVGRTARENPVF